MIVSEIRIIVERSENGEIFTTRVEGRDQIQTEIVVTVFVPGILFSKVGLKQSKVLALKI